MRIVRDEILLFWIMDEIYRLVKACLPQNWGTASKLPYNGNFVKGDFFQFYRLRNPFQYVNPSCFFRPERRIFVESIPWLRRSRRVYGFLQSTPPGRNGFDANARNFVPISNFSPLFSWNFLYYLPWPHELSFYKFFLRPIFLLDQQLEIIRQAVNILQRRHKFQSYLFTTLFQECRTEHMENWAEIMPPRSFVYEKKSTVLSYYADPLFTKYSKKEVRGKIWVQEANLARLKSLMTPELRELVDNSMQYEHLAYKRVKKKFNV